MGTKAQQYLDEREFKTDMIETQKSNREWCIHELKTDFYLKKQFEFFENRELKQSTIFNSMMGIAKE